MGRQLPAVLVALIAASSLSAAGYPREVADFIERREVCEHFRQEPWPEGPSAEARERREFIASQIKRFCRGSDKALQQLKEKFKDNREVTRKLGEYEIKIEME